MSLFQGQERQRRTAIQRRKNGTQWVNGQNKNLQKVTKAHYVQQRVKERLGKQEIPKIQAGAIGTILPRLEPAMIQPQSNEDSGRSEDFYPHRRLLASLGTPKRSYLTASAGMGNDSGGLNRKTSLPKVLDASSLAYHSGDEPFEDPNESEHESQADVDQTSSEIEFDEHALTHNFYSQHYAEVGESGPACERKEDIRHGRFRVQKNELNEDWSCVYRVAACQEQHSSFQGARLSDAQFEATTKERLRNRLGNLTKRLDSLQHHIFSSIVQYQDVLFPERTVVNAPDLREMLSLHILNHVFTTRDRILKNNVRLRKLTDNTDQEFRDQGFTRPKVLVLLPTRHSCFRYMETVISISKPDQEENRKRFLDEFFRPEDSAMERPEDFCELFAGNEDDMFRLGVKFTRKTIKYFSRFYDSDIIFASPLGLKMAIAKNPKDEEYDFLSSIEMLIIDQADAIMMQNWEHVDYILDHLNLQPKSSRDCDYSRVKDWYLNGEAHFLRQTIICSAYDFPQSRRLYTSKMLNIAGVVRYKSLTVGVMTKLNYAPRQTFYRIARCSPSEEPEERFEYFKAAVLPDLIEQCCTSRDPAGVLVYISDYADFTRLRNFLASAPLAQDLAFGNLSEYTTEADVRRARSHFMSGKYSMLLYTERAHHFRRYRVKGVKHVIMYSLPENPDFYSEVVSGFLGSSIASGLCSGKDTRAQAIFSSLDMLKLERVVGSDRCTSMLREVDGDTFDFV